MFAKTIMSIVLVVSSSVLSNAQKQSSPARANSLGYLRAKAGVGPWTLWKSEPLRSRLIALLGPEEFTALQSNMDPAEPMTISNGIMSSIGNRAHMGTEEEGALIIDLNRDVAEVLMLHDGKVIRGWAERNQYVPLPSSVLQRMQNWPQASLKQALANLQQAASTPSSGATDKNGPRT